MTGESRPDPNPGDRRERHLAPVVRFHAGAGVRVAGRASIFGLCAIIVAIGSAPSPLATVRALALGVAGAGRGAGGLLALALLGLALTLHAAPRITLGLGGWARSLPVDGPMHRRALVAALVIAQLPVFFVAVLCAFLVPLLYHAPLSAPKLVAVPLASLAAATAAALLKGTPARTERRRGSDRALTPLRLVWRALGIRAIALPLLPALLPLGAAWLYRTNNELGFAESAPSARLCATIALALYIAGVSDALVGRRPPWPWARSLPWSSLARVTTDALALAIPAFVLLLPMVLAAPAALGTAIAELPLLGALAAGAVRRGRGRITIASGELFLAAIVLGFAVTVWGGWAALVALALAPLALMHAARTERRLPASTWNELHHAAGGDSLSSSAT